MCPRNNGRNCKRNVLRVDTYFRAWWGVEPVCVVCQWLGWNWFWLVMHCVFCVRGEGSVVFWSIGMVFMFAKYVSSVKWFVFNTDLRSVVLDSRSLIYWSGLVFHMMIICWTLASDLIHRIMYMMVAFSSMIPGMFIFIIGIEVWHALKNRYI